jgi:hypothetical protein
MASVTATSCLRELSQGTASRSPVDRSRCIGSGDCVGAARDVFELDDDDKAV